MKKTKERLLFLLGVAICFAVAALSVLLEKLIPGGLLGGDLFQGSLREGAPRSGGGDCENSVLDLFTAEPSNLFVHALSLSRLRDSSLSEGAFFVSSSRTGKSADGCAEVTDISGAS